VNGFRAVYGGRHHEASPDKRAAPDVLVVPNAPDALLVTDEGDGSPTRRRRALPNRPLPGSAVTPATV